MIFDITMTDRRSVENFEFDPDFHIEFYTKTHRASNNASDSSWGCGTFGGYPSGSGSSFQIDEPIQRKLRPFLRRWAESRPLDSGFDPENERLHKSFLGFRV